MQTLIVGTTLFICASSAFPDIYQWYDGDGDGSLWLSDSIVEPYSDLSTQILWWADLQYANLHHADLSFTNFSYTNFDGANLASSDLSYANLFDSNLENTYLAFSLFRGTNLTASNINNANLFNADFSDADLSDVENWDRAFWLAARYTENTIFPIGMNPDDFGMIEIEIPTPGVFCLAGVAFVLFGRRRNKKKLPAG